MSTENKCKKCKEKLIYSPISPLSSEFICEMCKLKNILGYAHWKCPKCNLLFCCSCLNSQPYPTQKCLQNHELKFMNPENDKKEDFNCRNCGGLYSNKLRRFVCAECVEFYICPKCLKIPLFISDKCTSKNHVLKPIISAISKDILCSHCGKIADQKNGYWKCEENCENICSACKPFKDLLEIQDLFRSSKIKGLVGTYINIDCNINGIICEFSLTLHYHNLSESNIETFFELPIDKNIAISELFAEIEGKAYKGEIIKQEKAQEKYNDKIAAGKKSFLLTYEKDDEIVKLFIGNIGPKGTVKLLINMIKPIEIIENKYTLILPIGLINIGIPIEKFNISINDQKDCFEIESKSHKIIIKEKENFCKNIDVIIPKNNKENHDFVLTYKAKNIENTDKIKVQAIILQKSIIHKDEYAMFLNLEPILPTLSKSIMPEYLFLLDKSGSMNGKPIELAKEACLMFLKSLPNPCLFNIISFDSGFKPIFPNSVKYNKENLNIALKNLKNINANGGTELLPLLKYVFQNPVKKQEIMPIKFIYLLTDGQVDNQTEVFKIIEQNAKNCQIFSFGIGNFVDMHLIKNSAKIGRGEYWFLKENEDMSPKIISGLAHSMKTAMKEIKIEWPKNIEPILEGEINDIIYGESLSFMCIFKIEEENWKNIPIKITGIEPKTNTIFEFNIVIPHMFTQSESLLKLAAFIIMLNQKILSEEKQVEYSQKYKVLIPKTAILLTPKDIEIKPLLNFEQIEIKNEEMISLTKNKKQKGEAFINQEEFKEAFQLFDKDGDGAITTKELKMVLKACGQNVSNEEIQDMINEIDCDGNGTMDITDLFAISSSRAKNISSQDPHETKLLDIFKPFDYNADGRMIPTQILKIIELNESTDSRIIAEKVISKIALDKDGKISYADFIKQFINFHEPIQKLAEKPIENTSKSITYIDLVKLQDFDGFWILDSIENLFHTQFSNLIPKSLNFSDSDLLSKIWATLLSVYYLEIKCQDSKATWYFVYEKALSFLASHKIDYTQYQKIISEIINKL